VGWGWIVLIIVLVLLALPLFIPIIIRVRGESEAREFEYAVSLGPLALLPDLSDNLSRYKRAIGRPLYILTRPIVWLFIALVFLVRAILWPFKMILRLFRKKPRKAVYESIERLDASEDGSISTTFAFDEVGEDAEGTPEDTEPQHLDDSEDIQAHADAGSDNEPARMEIPEADEPPPSWDEADTDSSDDYEEPDWIDPTSSSAKKKSARKGLPQLPFTDMFTKGKAAFAQMKELLARYGRTGKRVIRAALLLGKESLAALNFRVLELHYSVGGDPATLGQILGWHYMMTGVLHPRVQRHVHFDPLWDSEQLAPAGHGNVVLYVWGYRFIPPLARFVFRMPWWGVFKIVREQVFKKK
jgi:hypothetical protein